MSVLDLRVLAERIPLVADRALVEIVNSTETAGHLADHRAGEGFFRRLWSKGTGADRKREVQGTQALARAQRLTVDLVRDLGEHLSFTNLNVALVSTRLDELARETEDSGRLARQSLGEVSELASVVASFMDITTRRLDSVEQRLDTHAALLDAHSAALLELERRQVHGELWQNSRDTVDALMRKWRTHGAYRSLPWPVQALLLARQLAAGKPGEHEAATGDREWRERLTDELLADPGYGELRDALEWRERLPLAALLSHVLAGLPGADERLMVAELLGAGLPPGLRPPHGPLALVTARTLELAVLRPQEQHKNLIHQARQDTFAECLTRPGAMTAQEFVRWAVEEQADAARAARGRAGRGLTPGGRGTLPAAGPAADTDTAPVPDPVKEGSA